MSPLALILNALWVLSALPLVLVVSFVVLFTTIYTILCRPTAVLRLWLPKLTVYERAKQLTDPITNVCSEVSVYSKKTQYLYILARD